MIQPSHWTAVLVAAALALGADCAASSPVTPMDDGSASGGLRQLADHGIQPAIVYDGAAFADLAGGLRRGTTYLGTLRLQLTLDGARLAGMPGMTLFVEGMNIHGGHPSRFAGDAQGVSSLEGPARWMLYEAWVQQNLFRNELSILIGRYDLNTEFYRLQSAGLFLNSSFGIGPEFSQSGRSGPSIFPDTSVGARIAWKPARSVVVRTAILDGVPVNRPDGQKLFAPGDGLLLVTEGAYLFRPASGDGPRNPRFRIGRVAGLPPYTAKVAFGTWHYTARYPDLSETSPDGQPVQHKGSSGAYALADVMLYTDTKRPARRLNLFAQLGVGDARLNHFAKYTGAGLVMSGLLKGRDSDELGVAIAAAHNSAHFAAQQSVAGRRLGRTETTFECSYLAPLTPHLAVQPDVQYVLSPDADPARKNAFVAMLRFELSF
jgi:porin